VARNVEVQAFAAPWVGDVIFDLVGGDRLIAQITLNTCPVPRNDIGREHERQSAVLDTLQSAGA
jgi:hypothetical protein